MKQLTSYEAAYAPLGGYLTAGGLGHTLTRVAEKLLWVLATATATLGLGEPFWLAEPARVVVLSAALLALFTLAAHVGPKGVRVNRTAPATAWLPRAAALVVWFWAAYGLLSRLAQQGTRQAAKAVLFALACVVVAVAGRSCEDGPAPERLPRRIAILAGAVALSVAHAFALVLLLDHYLDYTSWYFATWFVVAVLAVGVAAERAVDAVPRQAHRTMAACALAGWLGLGTGVGAYRAARDLGAAVDDNDLLVRRLEVASWIASHTASATRVASYNAGIIGYFSGRDTINLDGLVNNREFLPFLTRQRRMTEYLDLECVDLLTDYINGSQDLRRILSAPTVFGVDIERLSLAHAASATAWPGRPQLLLVFAVQRVGRCSGAARIDP